MGRYSGRSNTSCRKMDFKLGFKLILVGALFLYTHYFFMISVQYEMKLWKWEPLYTK